MRNLDPADATRFESIAVVTPVRAILDGIERHLDGRLIDQAVDAARRRGLIIGDEVSALAAAR